jgi:hypothetical protein
MLWTGVALPQTSRQIFGTVLAADLARVAFFGVGLAVCLGRVWWWKGSAAWRGVALALAAACGEGVVGGVSLAWIRALPWSPLTLWVPPLVPRSSTGGQHDRCLAAPSPGGPSCWRRDWGWWQLRGGRRPAP